MILTMREKKHVRKFLSERKENKNIRTNIRLFS